MKWHFPLVWLCSQENSGYKLMKGNCGSIQSLLPKWKKCVFPAFVEVGTLGLIWFLFLKTVLENSFSKHKTPKSYYLKTLICSLSLVFFECFMFFGKNEPETKHIFLIFFVLFIF